VFDLYKALTWGARWTIFMPIRVVW
jgi:hypothetical protein